MKQTIEIEVPDSYEANRSIKELLNREIRR